MRCRTPGKLSGVMYNGRMSRRFYDIHVHCIADGPQGKGSFVSRRFRRSIAFRVLKWFSGFRDGEEGNETAFFSDYLVRSVDSSEHLACAVVLAMDGIYGRDGTLDTDRTHYYVSNDFADGLCSGNRRMFFGASVNPCRRDALDELDRIAGKGAVLVKLLPNSQNIDLSDKRFLPYFRKLNEIGLPLLTHTGYEHTMKVYSQRLGDPARLRNALEEGVTVIAAHSGTGNWGSRKLRWLPGFKETFLEFEKLVSVYQTLYGDISAFASPARACNIRDVLGNGVVGERLINGSDFPVPCLPSYFIPPLGWTEYRRLRSIVNPFDRDIAVKRAMGFSDEVFLRAPDVIKGLGRDLGTGEMLSPSREYFC